jgi:hypothetical protein
MKNAILVIALAYFLLWGGLSGAAAQGFNSGTVTAHAATQLVSPISGGNWSILYGTGSIQTGVAGPNGTTVTDLTVGNTDQGTFIAKSDLPQVTDLRMYDTISVVTRINLTRIGGLLYLVDTEGRRRWYSYILRSQLGWQQPTYTLSAYLGEDAGFDLSSVQSLYFSQSGMVQGDVIAIGSIAFDVGLVDHCDYASGWSVDYASSGTISTSSDAITGTGSILADLYATSGGQADVAILGSYSDIIQDWSTKSYVSFYFKDDDPTIIHYFLIYDDNRNYREWLFSNDYAGQWIKVTGDLRDASYFQSGQVDLSKVQQFEVGIFGETPFQHSVFQIDEVAVH